MQTDHEGLYLGFDPGGKDKFGVAVLSGDCVIAATVSAVKAAIGWAVYVCGSRRPIAAGIDTLLHWATAVGGLRPCDSQLHEKHPRMKRSVMAPNGLYGAMAIGGVALAVKLREKWPELELNETHPKVLLHALCGPRYDQEHPETIDEAIHWFYRTSRVQGMIQGEHQLDAALSAWATREGRAKGWIDIVGASTELVFPVECVRYLWPPDATDEQPTQTRIGQPTQSVDMGHSAYPDDLVKGRTDECEIKLNGDWQAVGITAALDKYRGELMRCPECHGRVRVHKAGTTGQRAHFEHRTAHNGCSRSRTFSGHRAFHPEPQL
jgi:hypothetical protein